MYQQLGIGDFAYGFVLAHHGLQLVEVGLLQGFGVQTVDKQATTALVEVDKIVFGSHDKRFFCQQYPILVDQVTGKRVSNADRVDFYGNEIHAPKDYAFQYPAEAGNSRA